MKYAVIADIHGNYPALQLAMKDALEQGADQFVFLGDYCVSAAWPNEVIDELRTKDGAVSICGNEENYLKLPDGEDGQFAISRWAGRQLSDVNRKWLDGLPEEMELTADQYARQIGDSRRPFVRDTWTAALEEWKKSKEINAT